MQMQTERGLICVEADYQSAERCQMDGYSFMFHSKMLNADVYGIPKDEEGHSWSMALVVGY